MTLQEAITHAIEVAKDYENIANHLWNKQKRDSCRLCAEEHKQLAEWLTELKERREQDADRE